MAKHKLQRFAENETFENVFQPKLGYPPLGFPLKGAWKENFFKNGNPLVLELGCGRGEYTLSLARKHPDTNFIGVDIKGARLWRGAKSALEENLTNTAFLRIHIDQIHYYFGPEEVDEIWITFPDPQPQTSR
jgi:tRNA (guanine-N7-)-methyltransferase